MNKWRTTAAVLLTGTMILSGCSTGSEASQELNVTVKVNQAQTGMLGSGEIYTGKITPAEAVNITPKISGKVSSISVDVGTVVKKGQVLVKLEDEDLRNKLKIEEANVSAAETAIMSARDSRESGMVSANSGVVSAKGGVISSQNAIAQAESGINSAEAAVNQARTAIATANNTVKQSKEQLDKAKKNLSRTETLVVSSSATQVQLEEAHAALTSAQATYDNALNTRSNAETQLATAQKSLATAKVAYQNAKNSYQNANSGYSNAASQLKVAQSTAGIETSQQRLELAKVNLEIARNNLDNAAIASPISGVIQRRNIEVGEMASPSSPLLVIHNLDSVNLLIYVPADQVNTIQMDDLLQVRVPSSKVMTTGKVKSIGLDDANGNGFPVQITVSNPDGKLKSGMLADVSFIGTDAQEGVIVPTKAVQQENDKSYVYVAEQGHAVRKEVSVGSQSGSQTLITSGLTDGEEIIVNNLALLDNDTAITIAQY